MLLASHLSKAASTQRAAFLLLSISLIPLTQCKPQSNEPVEREESADSVEKKTSKYSYSQPHLGTKVHLVFYTNSSEKASQLSDQCFERVLDLNNIFSDYVKDSEINQLSRKSLGVYHRVSKELYTVIGFAQSISRKTDGAFDVTLGKHTKKWRAHRDRKVGFSIQNLLDKTSYKDLKTHASSHSVLLQKPLKLDLGGIAKGYVADQLMVMLQQAGVQSAAVIIGGEMVLADAPPSSEGWKIGLENPEKKIIGKLLLANTAVSTSGDSYQFFEMDDERQAHVLNPATKKGMSNKLNVTTIARTAMEADTWATALRVLPTEKALSLANEQPELHACFSTIEKPLLKTKKFPGFYKK